MSIESAIEGLTQAIKENVAVTLKALGLAVPLKPVPASTMGNGGPPPAKAAGRPKKDKVSESKKAPPVNAITKDDIKAQTLLAVVDHKLSDPIRALLTKMGVEKASELAESQYTEYMDAVGGIISSAAADKADGDSLF